MTADSVQALVMVGHSYIADGKPFCFLILSDETGALQWLSSIMASQALVDKTYSMGALALLQ